MFDAFAHPGNGALAVVWPVALDDEHRALLGTLVRHLNYLGRSESWIEGRLLELDEALPKGDPCWPCGDGAPAGSGWEQIRLLGVEPPDAYQRWREEQVAEALNAPEVALPASGKASKKLKERRDAIAAMYPADLWHCLTTTTSKLQGEGWSLPPGSRRLLYWRRADALDVAPPESACRPVDHRPEAILLSVSLPSGNLHALPPVRRTLPQAELFHRAAVSRLGRGRAVDAGLELVGRGPDDRPLQSHRHSHVLPLDLDGDGHLEHVLFWAPGGFGIEARRAIRGLRKAWAKGATDDLRLAVAAIGPVAALAHNDGPWGDGLRRVVGPGSVWRSVTPFVPPRHLKARGANSLEGQVKAELACRGLPEASSIRVFTRDEALDARLRHFVRVRSRGGYPPIPIGYGVEIEFEQSINGPLCLGYASHYGLGRFERMDQHAVEAPRPGPD